MNLESTTACRRRQHLLAGALCILACLHFGAAKAQPVRPLPENPRYLEFRGRPCLVVTAAEHYGAVLNQDFDYVRYLDTLAADGMNYTRIFTGAYVEGPGSFGIQNNSLAPQSGRFLAPWARSSTPGYRAGGNKFDLERWDERYFERLHDFVTKAAERGILVEVTLFSSLYGPNWQLSPLHPANNVNGTPDLTHRQVHTLDNQGLLEHQLALVEKIVTELNVHDNVIFEVQNEPYADRPLTIGPINPFLLNWREVWQNRVDLADEASLAWQRRIVDAIVATEAALPKRHLVAQNFCNFGWPLEGVHPQVAILNFHYASPQAILTNYGWRKVVSYDETGFLGSDIAPYRRQAWRFVSSGGGIFNHLDYSFYPGAEDGTGENRAPGSGGPELRRQLKALADFIGELPFWRMTPFTRFITHAPGIQVTAMGAPGEAYVAYLEGTGPVELMLETPPGEYRLEFLNPVTGERGETVRLAVQARRTTWRTPAFEGELAVRLVWTNKP
ncbi:MAG: hypothetical protein Kow00109_21520 [Acidobacteriota bacterium]